MRIVQGVPISWDTSIVTIKSPNPIKHIAWSPCSKFVAISLESAEIQILDGVTLKQLKLFTPPHHSTHSLAFSPESRLLTWAGEFKAFITWDLQTGVQVSEISIEEGSNLYVYTITYSECGTMFGVLFKGRLTNGIGISNVLSSTPMYYHSFEGPGSSKIWRYGECIWYATLEPWSITIWEIGFTPNNPPTEVRVVPIPNHLGSGKQFIFAPGHLQVAIALEKAILVWDIQDSKLLLNSTDIKTPEKMAFSSDGQFLVCGFDYSIYLWKRSPAGYTLHQKVPSSALGKKSFNLLLSPNGQTIVVSGYTTLELWHTAESTISTSHAPVQTLTTPRFLLEFSPDGSLAVTAQLWDTTATVLDLKSGVTQFIIDTGMEIYGLGVAWGTVVAIGDGKVITWNLPPLGPFSNVRMNIDDGIETTTFDRRSAPFRLIQIHSASISADFNHIALLGISGLGSGPSLLNIYDVSTGEHLASSSSHGQTPWFTPDGYEIWCLDTKEAEGWAISKDNKFDITELEKLGPIRGPSGGFPWQSPHGCQVIDDGWIISSTGKCLLWLPPRWRSIEQYRVWGEQFLGLSHPGLSEVVILELLEE